VLRVSIELPEPVMDGGEKEAVTPEGSPLAEKVTVPLKLFESTTLI